MQHLVVEAESSSGFPPSIDLFWYLETLVVSHYGEVAAPAEIWKMARLRHVEFSSGGLHLLDPPGGDTDVEIIMENLQTLKGVHNLRFTKEVVKRIRNIKKLGVEFDGDVKSWSHDYYCFSNFELLHKLESFRCCIRSESDEELQNLTFPHSIKKLSLRSYYVHWEDILEKIGSLPLLQNLVLQDGCFRASEWETVEGQFSSLKVLSLESCDDLERWMTESSHFPRLEHLRLYGLRELDEVPVEIGDISTLRSIELVYCSESAVESMRKIVDEQEELQGEELSFRVRALVRRNEHALKSFAGPNFQVEVGSF